LSSCSKIINSKKLHQRDSNVQHALPLGEEGQALYYSSSGFAANIKYSFHFVSFTLFSLIYNNIGATFSSRRSGVYLPSAVK
jgi:hypothetical protein